MGSRSARKFYGAAGHRMLKAVQDLKPPYRLDASHRSTSSWRRLHPFCRFATFPPTGARTCGAVICIENPTRKIQRLICSIPTNSGEAASLSLWERWRGAQRRDGEGGLPSQALNFQPLPPSVQHVQNPCALFDTFSTLSLDTMRKNMIKYCCHNAKSPS
jgi:hypothetical protein